MNCGSSSIKYKLFEMESKQVMAQGGIEKIGLPDSFLLVKLPNGEKVKFEKPMPEHTVGIELILEKLVDPQIGCIKDLKEINAVGHRVVHGGEKFNKSVLITPEVKAQIIECIDLAPLHNPANLKGIDAIEKILPGVPQVAVFDTAFHQTMPPKAYTYALPYEISEKYDIRRYGFHGTSHRYVSHRVADFLGKKYEDLRIITCHLGNGSSFAAVKDGKCQDTSMGLTPLAGICMGTRTGDIDPAIVPFLMKNERFTPDEMDNLLNKQSGVQGVSGVSSDFRDLEKAANEGNERARLALDMFAYQGKKIIGSYAAAMGGVDVIVFTAGIGENTDHMRKAMCEGLEFMGVEFDADVNAGLRGKEAIISKPSSKVTVCVIPTNEELAIAQETEALVRK